MNALGRGLRAAVARVVGGEPTGADVDPRSAVLDAIARIRHDQAAIEAQLGGAIVDAATLERAVGDQQRVLHEAGIEIRDALVAAERAADRAAAEGSDADAVPYRLAADGFGVQLRVLRATMSQLDRLHGGAADNLELTRRLLRESADALDRALRAEIELLERIERLDRERVIAATRRRPGGTNHVAGPDQPGGPG